MLAKEPDLCRDTTFVDVDFPALMQKKSQIITEQPALRDLLDKVSVSLNTRDVYLQSEHYIAIGCDLRDIKQLDALLRHQLDLPNCTVLVVAEVSITYMEPDAADELVCYTSGLGDGRRPLSAVLGQVSNELQSASVSWSNTSRQALITRLRSKCWGISTPSILL